MQTAITIDRVAYDYTGEKALQGLSLEIPAGSLFGLIGADGAGKSTLFRLLSTLQTLQQGEVHIFQWQVGKHDGLIRSSLGYMPQQFSLYSDLTVKENIRFAAEIMDMPKNEISAMMQDLLDFSRLKSVENRRAGKLSGGMKQKLALCCALIRRPRLLLLDEPTVGVDPVTRRDFWDMLSRLKEQGTTIVVSTPYMDEAELCDEVVLIHQGKIVGQGRPSILCHTLPGRLWVIRALHSLEVGTYEQPPQPLQALYVMGGELHALASQELDARDVLTAVQARCPEAETIEPAVVRVEDVFLQVLRTVQQQEMV